MNTPYHATYFAHELTKRCPSDSVGKLAASLSDAQGDLNPHQVEAALFAFQSPLSKGAILADEVGLGKTIEAGILLSQRWAERKRRLLIIVPSNLRKQWSQELADKFFLPSVILEARSFNVQIKAGNLNPFRQADAIIICSYQFARSKEPYVAQTGWDLVVIDEAHRLRNVYKIANSIKNAVAAAPKALLTATPLQNSLLELYGLVSIVDEFAFGDLKSFKAQYGRLTGTEDFLELKKRLQPLCKRTLRRQVLEYIKFTNRIPVTQEFYPSDDEQRLYDLVSEYLQRPSLFALPSQQRKLMTLILRKLLASSTYAISGTLHGLADKLEEAARRQENVQDPPADLLGDFENYDELEDEWDDESTENRVREDRPYTPDELVEVREEIATLREFSELARSIIKNSKGEVLLTALKNGFARARENGGSEKAIIFTESVRTQDYLRRVLEQTEFAGQAVLFNGTNNDPQSREIHARWLARHAGTDRVSGSPTADKRAALVDYFRDEAAIMIATEAAAEGINLQFCSLVVNFDLPWNPQRIEQRIGRCHRYGQKHDVVVVNFLNKANAADQRVFQLLDEKFRLFNGVFGASDEVLGAIESGIDFEKRIVEIYQRCRTEGQIEFEFDQLQRDLEPQIEDRVQRARRELLENFDEEVHEKLRLRQRTSAEYLDRYENWLWQLTRWFLAPHARFAADGSNAFTLTRNPFPDEPIHMGPYRAGRHVEDANTYRVGHPLAQRIIAQCKATGLKPAELVFDLSASQRKIAVLAPLVGRSGWLSAVFASVSALEVEEHVLFAAVTDDGQSLDPDQCQRLFGLPAEEGFLLSAPDPSVLASLAAAIAAQHALLLQRLDTKNTGLFDQELEKLDRWGEDRRSTLRLTLRELEDQIKELKRSARSAPNLPEKLRLERERRQRESRRDEAWKEYEDAARDIEKQKDTLMEEVERKLERNEGRTPLFTIRWRIR